MSSTSFNIKPPENRIFSNRKNFSKQGKCLSHKRNLSVLTQTSLNFKIKQNLKFESIFQSLTSQSLKRPVKSQRKYFKPASSLEINQMKMKIQVENERRNERSLKSLLLTHRQKLRQTRSKSQLTKKIEQKPTNLQCQSPKFKLGSQKAQNIAKRIHTQNSQDERKLLESTNFSIRSVSYISKQIDQTDVISIQNKRKKALGKGSIRPKSNRAQGASKILTNQYSDDSLQQTESNKATEQSEIQIRLSLKSLSKSQIGQSPEPQTTMMQKWIMEQNKRILIRQKNEINAKPEGQRRPILTGVAFKQNRMILKFDKRILNNSSQVNDPCLKINRIKPISCRMKSDSKQ